MTDILFSKVDIFQVLENQKTEIRKKVYSLESDYLLNTSENDLIEWLIDELNLEVPVILDSEIYIADSKETKVDISQDRNRWITDRSRPVYLEGHKTVIAIPFEGDANFFDIRPSTYTTVLPHADIKGKEIRLVYEQVDSNAEAVKGAYIKTLDQIKQYLGWLSQSVDQYNAQLETQVKNFVQERKSKLVASAGMVESLGLPIKQRANSSNTYAVPVRRKKPRIEKPKATTTPYKPEPMLPKEEYENILSIMKNMVSVMEKSPKAFENMDEEDLRTHFLVQLNGQYEGQATGETFNYQGKTDILISQDGKNIFIAECKFWKGEKAFLETIDQLFRYLTWRDTRTSILLFNRNKDFSAVLDTLKEATLKHECFKQELDYSDETTFRYIFNQPDDKNREIYLTVMAFDVPTINN